MKVQHFGSDSAGLEVIEEISNVDVIFFGTDTVQIISIQNGVKVPIEKPISWISEIVND